jgi:hypothetical protein
MANEVWNQTQVHAEAAKLEQAALKGDSTKAFSSENWDIEHSSTNPGIQRQNAASVTAQLQKDGFLPVVEFDLAKSYKDRHLNYCEKPSGTFDITSMHAGNDFRIGYETNGLIEKAIVEKLDEGNAFDTINPAKHQRPESPADVSAAPKSNDVPSEAMEAKMNRMLSMMEAMQKKNAELERELADFRSGKTKPNTDGAKETEPKKKEAEERKDDPAKKLDEAKKLVEEAAKREAEAKKKEAEEKKDDPAKKLEEAKKLVEEATKREAEAKKKEAELNDPAKKLAEARKLVAEDDARKNAEAKVAEAKLAEAKAAEAKLAKAAVDAKLAQELEQKIEIGPNVKSMKPTHNAKGDLVSKEYEFNNPSWLGDTLGPNYKTSALEKFDSKGQVDSIEHKYDNGWVFTTRPQNGDKGAVYAQRPAVTHDADPAKYDELSAKYGTTVYNGETYARTRPLQFPGYQQIDRDNLSYPPSFRWNKLNTARTGDW